MKVHFTPEDWSICKRDGLARDAYHRSIGAQQVQFYEDDAEQLRGAQWDIQGVIGEYAVYKLFELPWSHDPTRVRNTYDIIFASGLKGEIKYVTSHGYRFGIDERYSQHFHGWDVGLLVQPTISEDTYSDPDVRGVIAHNRFWKENRKEDWHRGGDVYCVENRSLTYIELMIYYETEGYK